MADLRAALCVIRINSIDFCTGWLADSDGCLVSAGHPFVGTTGTQEFECIASDGKSLGTAVLLQAEYEEHGVAIRDFAVLKLLRPPPQSLRPLPIDRTNNSWEGAPFTSCGFFGHNGTHGAALLRGAIDGPIFPYITQSQHWCYRLKTDFDTQPGFSGAPILVHGKVVAVQSGRIDAKPTIAFATPLSSITANNSANLCKSLQEKCDDWASRFNQLVESLPRLVPWTVPGERWAVTVGPQQLDEPGSKIVDALRNGWDDWQATCLLPIGAWSWLAPKPVIKLEPQIRSRDEARQLPESWHHYAGTSAVDPLADEDVTFVRVLVDCEADLETVTPRSVPGLSELSHVLVVQLRLGTAAVARTAEHVNIQQTTPETVARTAFDWFANLVLDINVFHRSRVLPALFPNQESRRLFSEIKASYLAEQGFLSVGEIVSGGTFTIAEHCRSPLTGKVDIDKYERLWRGFIDRQLVVSTSKPSRAPLGSDDAAAKIVAGLAPVALIELGLLGHGGLAGQLSARNILKALRKRFGNEVPHDTGLHAFVIMTRRPPEHGQRLRLANLMGFERWRRNQAVIVRFGDLKRFVCLSPYVKFVFFKL